MIDAGRLVRIETELAAIMPAPHARYSLPLAELVGEPLGLEGTSGQSAYQVQVKGALMKLRITIEVEQANDLGIAIDALEESDLGGHVLDAIKIEVIR